MASKAKSKTKRHICVICRRLFPENKIEFGPDPYDNDVHNDPTPVWECKLCRRERAADI